MLVANFQNVTKTYGAQEVLRGASFTVSSGQKVGLIGANGSGKTTILRILAGAEQPSGGNAGVPRAVRLGYVPQRVVYDDAETVTERLLAEHARLTAELRKQERRLARASADEMDGAMHAYQRARDAYDHADGDALVARAGAMLDALGLAGKADQPIGSLSGGEKNVLALAQALLSEPDLLLLDEPDNHLDYFGVAWLEDFLARFRGAVVIVSHSRYLLDRVVDSILHLEAGVVRQYSGNYSSYRAAHLRHLIAQQADYVANRKRLAQLEALVQRFADIARGNTDPAWGRRLRARRRQLERERAQAVEQPTLGPDGIHPDFSAEATKADVALQLRGYSKAFGDLVLFEDARMDVACGERVALVGPNGSGKTTLLRDVVQNGAWENPTVRIGPSLTVGYCAQEQEVLEGDRTIFEEICATSPMGREGAFGVLGRFLFGPDDMHKRVGELSGGERNRLQLARLTVLKPNFLILDEPTNHLDIMAREAVEDALADYEGTILVVSHDRYFLEKIVTRVVEVRDRRLVAFPGGFAEFWQARGHLMSRAVGRVSTRGRERKRRLSKTQKPGAVSALERRIAEAERRKVDLESAIAEAFTNNDRRTGRRLGRRLAELQSELDRLYEEWMARAE